MELNRSQEKVQELEEKLQFTDFVASFGVGATESTDADNVPIPVIPLTDLASTCSRSKVPDLKEEDVTRVVHRVLWQNLPFPRNKVKLESLAYQIKLAVTKELPQPASHWWRIRLQQGTTQIITKYEKPLSAVQFLLKIKVHDVQGVTFNFTHFTFSHQILGWNST